MGILRGSISGSSKERENNLKTIKELEGLVGGILKNKKKEKDALVEQLIGMNKEAINSNEEEKEESNEEYPALLQGEEVVPTPMKARPPSVTDAKTIEENIDADLKLIQGEMLLWKGLLQLQSNDRLKGGISLRKSWGIYKSIHSDIVKNNSYHQDVQDICLTGVGTFYYIMSILPAAVAKVLSLIGFVQNREQGIAYLHQVFENDGLSAPNAALMLAVNYLFVPRALADPHESLRKYAPLLQRCLIQYPNGSMFRYISAMLVKKNGAIESSITHLAVAMERCKELGKTPNLFIFELGQSHFQKLNFEEAAKCFTTLVNIEEDFDFKTFAGLELACCHTFEGDLKKAQAMIDKIPSLVKSKPGRIDSYIMDKLKIIGKLWNNDPKRLEVILKISAFEMLYLRRDLAHMVKDDLEPIRKRVQDGRARIKELNAENDLSDILAATLVILAQIDRNDNDVEKAKKKLTYVLNIQKRIKYETQWAAFSNYEMGEILYSEGKLKESYDLMKAASKFSKYPFEEILKARINLAKKQLSKEMKG